MADNVRVLIADDHKLFREGLKALLSSIPDVEVVGEAASGGEAIDQVMATRPDVVLMDIQMPDQNGIEATRALAEAAPEVGVIVVTMLEDDDSVFAAMRAGARGYLLKGAGQAEMLRGIRTVAEGGALFGPGVAERLVGYFTDPRRKREPAFPELTERELEVLELVARGSNKQAIAEELVISSKTVSNHLSNIYNKLQVADRAEAMLRARQAGLGKDAPP